MATLSDMTDSAPPSQRPGPILETRSLILRLPTYSDVPFLLSNVLSPLNNKYLPHFIANPSTYEKSKAWVDLMIKGYNATPQTNVFLVIEEKETGDVIGDSGLGRVFVTQEGEVRADVGVMIDSTKTRRGYAVETLYRTMEWGFEEYVPVIGDDSTSDKKRIEAIDVATLEENVPMRSVFESVFGLVGQVGERSDGLKERTYELRREQWLEEGGIKQRVKKWLDQKAKNLSKVTSL